VQPDAGLSHGGPAGQSERDSHTQTLEISERHRHRYEFNREYEALLTGAGLRITGTTPDATYVEIVELPGHPFFLGCQFHPEFKSKPLEPHPLFRAFIKASYLVRGLHGAKYSYATSRS
jgi:CTP synthase